MPSVDGPGSRPGGVASHHDAGALSCTNTNHQGSIRRAPSGTCDGHGMRVREKVSGTFSDIPALKRFLTPFLGIFSPGYRPRNNAVMITTITATGSQTDRCITMRDHHRNIFCYYKGAAQDDKDREQQLEDNTTKALINTLDYCSPSVATSFLEWLDVRAPGSAEYVLQKTTIGSEKIRRKAQRLMLAIVGAANKANESVCAQLPAPVVKESRPDAWVYGDEYAVLIESKVGKATLTLDQMASHWEKLKPTCPTRIVTWAQVHKLFVKLMHQEKDTQNKWLLKQFTEYLEWTGMTEFVGFCEEMFEFFVQGEKDPDTKQWVRGTVEALADKVLGGDKGLKQFNSFYGSKHVGNLGKESDHYWVAFGPEHFRELAHQTISLYEESLDVFVNVELLPAVKKLRKKVQTNDAQFKNLICQLPAPFAVRIEERKPTGLPRKFDYYAIAEVEGYGLKDSESPGFDYILALINQTQYPYLSVRRRIPRAHVLELSKPNPEVLVDEVTGLLKAFHPLVEFINQ
jgi:hypothetical protein